MAPMTGTPRPWNAGSRWAARTWPTAPAPCLRTSACRLPAGAATVTDLPMTALSGGQAARVGLAALLLSRFDVLLLDEPTNDLDLDGLARLEAFVTGQRVGVVVVSHDRAFLARCVTTVVELDLAQQRVGVFGGGYQAYLAEREVGRRQAREAYEQYADRRSDLQERGRMQRAWMDAGVRKAAQRKDNDKIGRNFRVEQTEKQAAKARQTDRMIERLPEVAEPRKEWELQYAIQAAPRSGTVVAVARGAVARLRRLHPRPARPAGRRSATGSASPEPTVPASRPCWPCCWADWTQNPGRSRSGPGWRSARLTRPGNCCWARRRCCAPSATWSPTGRNRRSARCSPSSVCEPNTWSGRPSRCRPGERTRAALALLQARGVNLLVLDEPTNHLDLPAIEQLEQALEAYTGTLLLVTHDRRMLEAVGLTRHWNVADGVVRER